MLHRAASTEGLAGATVARATSQVGQASTLAVMKRMLGLPTYALSTQLSQEVAMSRDRKGVARDPACPPSASCR